MRLAPLVKYLPAPLVVGLVGLAFLMVMSRLDGIQSARIAALDQQQAKATQQTLDAAKSYRATKAQSEAVDRENARLRAAVAQREALAARLRHRADSLAGALTPVLAALPDSVSHPVLRLLALKDSVIVTQAGQIQHLNTIIDIVTADRDRWRTQTEAEVEAGKQWQTVANGWKKEATKGCLPLIGCVGRSTILVVGLGLGVTGGLLASH